VAPLLSSSQRGEESQLADADGSTPSEVSALSAGEQAALVEEHYERTQRVNSSVRLLIAQDGWLYRGNIDGGFAAVANERTAPCDTVDLDCYTVGSSFTLVALRTDDELHTLSTALEAAGWDGSIRTRNTEWAFTATNDDGFELHVSQNEEDLAATVVSPPWWGLGEEVIRSENSTDPAPSDRTVQWPADAWPAMDAG
jgi:hypothetical protein